MRRRTIDRTRCALVAVAAAAVVGVAGCGGSTGGAAATSNSSGSVTGSVSSAALTSAGGAGSGTGTSPTAGYPVSLENCGRTVTVDAAPQRVVSLWQAPTEMMLALGLGDRITAVAGNYSDFPADLAGEAAKLPSIGTSMSWPSKEVLLSENPDLVIGQSLEGFAFDTASGYASVQQIEDTGAKVYGANLCSAADALNMTVDTTAKTLGDLGRIFDVTDRADALIAELNTQKQTVVDAVAGKPTVKVAYFNGGEGPLNVLAGGIYDSAIQTAGGTNVFPRESVFISKEEFAASTPDVILVGTFQGQDAATLRDYLKTNFPEMTAVQNDRIVEVPVSDTDASIGVMKGLTEIANALHPDLNLTVPTP